MNPVRVKLDENLGLGPKAALLAAGYDADRVTDEGLSSASDRDLWQRCQAEGRLLVTLDLDFSDIRAFPPGSHHGILLLRPGDNSRNAVLAVLQRVLSEIKLASLVGCLAVADKTLTRVRRPPAA